jgi:two-component system invasion response regulator UvrY
MRRDKTDLPLKLAIVDDHRLFRKGLISLIDVATDNTTIVLFEADNGEDLQQKIAPENQPDILLMDINMPGMDGFASVEWLNRHYPLVKVLVVSMIEKEESIVRMLKLGVKGYLGKDVEPKELREALFAIADKGFYYTDFITGKLIHSIQNNTKEQSSDVTKLLNERELEFLRFACSELTYNEIAARMFLSPKTIDGYRGSLFEKLNIKTRVGLALFAVKHGLVSL